jgi:hypothetical protein
VDTCSCSEAASHQHCAGTEAIEQAPRARRGLPKCNRMMSRNGVLPR